MKRAATMPDGAVFGEASQQQVLKGCKQQGRESNLVVEGDNEQDEDKEHKIEEQ